MTDSENDTLGQRVLILAPLGKDASLTQTVLGRYGIEIVCCSHLQQLCDELSQGAAAAVLVEEAISQNERTCLNDWLEQQPAWSDLPLLVLARPGADSAAVALAMDQLGNVTVLERPMRVASLISSVRTALRARQRQYQIRDHLAEREQAAESLRAADRRKDEFLAILAHELRNPLAPIRNSVHILRLTAGNDPTAEQISEVLERQVKHMVRLVDDLLEISRITRGKIELRKEHIDLATVVRSAVEASRPLLEAAGHQFTLSLPSERLALHADPVRLAQVFANLLNNAAKYTDAGGEVILSAVREGRTVVLRVRDTGAGIAADMLEHVFDMFTQIDRSAARAQGGLGIGLTLVKSLVELHGGGVQALSEGPGHGSEFIVRLPLAVDHMDTNGQTNDAANLVSLAGERILVADDNHDAAESLASLLKLLGAEVHVAYNGFDAIEAFETLLPNVVLLDIGMPGMDGYETARRIRQQANSKAVTLIALTGWGQERDHRSSVSAGFDYHLTKPADFQMLQSVLASARG